METAAQPREAGLARLEAIIHGYGPTITAFSGGVDSTLVAVVAARVHRDRALAVTGVSPSLATSERTQAQSLATCLKLAHRLIATGEMARPAYRANMGDRCYHCKTDLYARLRALAAQEGYAAVASGDNLDDLSGHRPGMRAAAEHGVKTPLIEAGLGKAEVRDLALQLKLPNHAKPAAPCLASRIPHGTRVEPEILQRIEAAETAVRALGFSEFRVRHHGNLARLEIAGGELLRAFERRVDLVRAIKRVGYRWVALDLETFRSGSLNVVLQDQEQRPSKD